MISQPICLRTLASRSALLLALSAGWLLAFPAAALPVFFDAPSGFGISSTSADAASEAGFTRLTPAQISQASAFGITIPDPLVLTANVKNPPSTSDPTTITSRWTVQNGGAHTLVDPWLVFLNPLDSPAAYDHSKLGIDLQAGQWGVVQVSQGETQYFYPAVHLGNLAAGGSEQFDMHHLLGTPLVQQQGNFVLPRYGVAMLATVPGPLALPLLGMLLGGLALRRRSAA